MTHKNLNRSLKIGHNGDNTANICRGRVLASQSFSERHASRRLRLRKLVPHRRRPDVQPSPFHHLDTLLSHPPTSPIIAFGIAISFCESEKSPRSTVNLFPPPFFDFRDVGEQGRRRPRGKGCQRPHPASCLQFFSSSLLHA